MLQQHYATKSGIKLPESPPEFPVNFHPVPGKYITLSPKTGQQSKNYSYWAEVVKWIQPVLRQKDIWIVQLGEIDEPPILGCVPKMGISFRESAFLVQNALLHLSGDSCFVHFAGFVKTPVIALYGSTLPEATGPYYRGKFKALRGNNGLPSFRPDEKDPEINKIKPEEVINAVFEELEFDARVNFKTISIGEHYGDHHVSLIPDFVPDFNKISKAKRFALRLDYVHNEQLAAEILKNRERPTMIIVSQPLSKDFLSFVKGKVSNIKMNFSDNYSIEKLKELKNSGIPYTLIWRGNRDKLGDVRLDLLDFDPVYEKKVEKVEEVNNQTVFKTSHIVLGRGNNYPSFYHYKKDLPFKPGSPVVVGEAYKENEFWESKEAYFFFKGD